MFGLLNASLSAHDAGQAEARATRQHRVDRAFRFASNWLRRGA